MAEILVKAQSVSNADAVKDRRGCYKRGMPVVVMPDGHSWGLEERLPRFVVIKIPTIAVSTVQKYLDQEREIIQGPGGEDREVVYRKRRWIIRWVDLPAAAQNKLASTGELVIKAGAYNGSFDYTWTQVKSFFRDQMTGTDETADI